MSEEKKVNEQELEKVAGGIDRLPTVVYRCPNCGREVSKTTGLMAPLCNDCGTRMVTADPLRSDRFM